MTGEARAALIAQLERARALGFLGPGEVQAHIDHAAAFLEALTDVAGTVVDLGSGGGVPGLVVGVARPDLHLVLLDATAKRCRFLEAAVAALRLDADVAEGRAELLARGALRGSAAAVLARSFAAPAPTAECAAPLLRVGGRLVVSEPPDRSDRWPIAGVAPLGLEVGHRTTTAPQVQILLQVWPCPDEYPRREGIPAKRCRFLEGAVAAMGLDAEVAEGRAELLGRGPLRGSAAAVLARSFAAPAPTAECAAPLLEVGGRLIVSEPPDRSDRWPVAGVARLGLELGPRSTTAPQVQVLVQVRPCPEAYPRREGVPAKRPLF